MAEEATEQRQSDERSHGQRIADLIERYCQFRETALMYPGVVEKLEIAKAELAAAIDDLAAEIPTELSDLI